MGRKLARALIGGVIALSCSNGDDPGASRPDSGHPASGGGGTGGAGPSSGGQLGVSGKASGGARSGSGGSVAPGTGGVDGRDGGDRGDGGSSAGGAPPGSGGVGNTLSRRYPNDVGIGTDANVLFHSDFESNFDGWTSHTQDRSRLDVLADSLAHAGSRYLRAQVTRAALAADTYVSAQAQVELPKRVPELFFRFYARFVGSTAVPHHWVRVAAGDASFASDGLANTVPPGDRGFWYDLDARRDQFFNFYAYWYKMRSGRCNDGSATPGCAGDQGTTYHYGNNFTPAGQSPFPRDAWFCLETRTKVNAVGSSDGELALYMNDALVGEYVPGAPRGRWLRDNFYTWGPYYQDDQAFEGFDFRSSAEVLLKRITLDAYYEKGSLDDLAQTTPVPEAQVILYDDVVVATERIGCQTR